MNKKFLNFLILACLLIASMQQDGNNYNGKVNFEGDFDSMNHINPSTQEKDPFVDEEENIEDDN